jgi:hypothetical protein
VPAKNPGVVIPLKLGFAAFALANAFAYILILDSKPSAVCGAWSVNQILESGTGTSTDDSMPWKKIFFERENGGIFSGSVKDSNGSKTNFRYEIRPEAGELSISFINPAASPGFDGRYSFADNDTLQLAGRLGGHPVEWRLTRLK